MSPVRNGIDRWVDDDFRPLKGCKVGVLCNQASVNRSFEHTLDLIVGASSSAGFEVVAAFGPQHGIWGHTQDNMIEWEGYRDSRTGLPFYSLYGKHRKPTPAMLEGMDTLVVDIQDVGARYYTFIWTMSLCMEACQAMGIRVVVLDRVNPIGGVTIEGTVMDPAYRSFVGWHPLPLRHGLTVGEVARYVQQHFYPGVDLRIVPVEGWDAASYADENGHAWVPPSPNMPTVDTAVVYPGMCLLEGTNMSEGRGTTRPFETIGHPDLDAWEYATALNSHRLPGVVFRPVWFQPTFQKHAEKYCGGAFIHVVDRNAFEPVLAAIAVLREAKRLAPDGFAWNPPPYEYEDVLLPIDILAGHPWVREAIDAQEPLEMFRERMRAECEAFEPKLQEARIYRR